MNKYNIMVWSLLSFFLITLSSCEAIEAVFKAGMWTMLIIIVAIVALVAFIIRKMRR